MLGHRQAFAWLDEWYGMTLEDVRTYEASMQKQTNEKVVTEPVAGPSLTATTSAVAAPPESPKSPTRGWLSWS